MAITTYAELQTAVETMLHRSGQTSQIPDFIALAEAQLNRELRVPEMETTATVTTSTSTRYAALPSRFLDVSAFVDPYGEELESRTIRDVTLMSVNASAGLPSSYAITTQFEFDCVSDSAYSLTLIYYKSLDIATDSTNWLLTRHPDAYLYLALSIAALDSKDYARAQMWKGQADISIASANTSESARSNAILRCGIEFETSTGFDITNG